MSALENAKNMSVEDILAKTAASGLLEFGVERSVVTEKWNQVNAEREFQTNPIRVVAGLNNADIAGVQPVDHRCQRVQRPLAAHRVNLLDARLVEGAAVAQEVPGEQGGGPPVGQALPVGELIAHGVGEAGAGVGDGNPRIDRAVAQVVPVLMVDLLPLRQLFEGRPQQL